MRCALAGRGRDALASAMLAALKAGAHSSSPAEDQGMSPQAVLRSTAHLRHGSATLASKAIDIHAGHLHLQYFAVGIKTKARMTQNGPWHCPPLHMHYVLRRTLVAHVSGS